MKNKDLYNQKNKIQLIEDLKNESFNRVTYSFYKYITIHNLSKLRNKLYIEWKSLNILGRIYIAKEGINALNKVRSAYSELQEYSSKLYNIGKTLTTDTFLNTNEQGVLNG